MSTKHNAMNEAERFLPLLRSIGREIRERGRAIDSLEERLTVLSEDREQQHVAIAQVESELSTQRREMRRVERELTDLGWRRDADHPLRIRIPGRSGSFTYEGQLDKTRFYRTPSDVKV